MIVSYLFHGSGKITLATSFPGCSLYSKRDWLLGSSVSVDANARNTTFHFQTLDFQTTQNLFKNGKTNGTRNVFIPGMRNKKHLTKWKLKVTCFQKFPLQLCLITKFAEMFQPMWLSVLRTLSNDSIWRSGRFNPQPEVVIFYWHNDDKTCLKRKKGLPAAASDVNVLVA